MSTTDAGYRLPRRYGQPQSLLLVVRVAIVRGGQHAAAEPADRRRRIRSFSGSTADRAARPQPACCSSSVLVASPRTARRPSSMSIRGTTTPTSSSSTSRSRSATRTRATATRSTTRPTRPSTSTPSCSSSTRMPSALDPAHHRSAFPQYKSVPFHIAAESYGGHYAPQFASYIHTQNLAIAAASALAPIPHKHIPLASVLIGNGLTEPYTQFATVPEYACAPSPTAIFDEATCTSIRSKVGTCQRLQQFCYSSPSRFTCTPAALYCWSNIVGTLRFPTRR